MNNNPNESWYSPLAPAEDHRREEPPKKKKRISPAWRAVLATLLAVALITGSSMIFSGGSTQPSWEGSIPVMPMPKTEKPSAEDEDPLPDSGFPGGLLPDDVIPDTESPEDYPEDWRKFFENFFVADDSVKEEIRVPKIGRTIDWELALRPAGKRELTLQEVYQRCAESIVAIKSFANGKLGYYWGTGIIMSEDGLILTNAHLLEGCDSATVILPDNAAFEAQLVGADSASDIAVLKIDSKGLRAAEFGDSDALAVGEHVAAIGNPLGEEFRTTLTDGIVSAIGRGVSYNGRSMTLIQTNTAINEGNSGGALFNMYGQVVGVTNMKMMSNFSSIEGIGFAIPSATVCSIANALIRDGVVKGRTAVGITVGAVSGTPAEHYELPEGLYVSEVSEGSDAKAKGVREGDIITAVNGQPVKTTDDILSAKESLGIGDTMTFTIWRDGESFDVDVALIEYNDVY